MRKKSIRIRSFKLNLKNWIICKYEDFKYRRWAVERSKVLKSIYNLDGSLERHIDERTRYILSLEKRISELENKLKES